MHRGRHHRRRRARAGPRRHCGEPGLSRCLSLIAPGIAARFAGFATGELPLAPALSLWLRRAAVSDFPAVLTEQAIAALCGIDAAEAAPVAHLSYLEDFGEPPPACCLRADPVHLRADTTGLILFDAASFELEAEESHALGGALATHLAEDGWQLRQRHPHRWYLVGDNPPDLGTLPLPAARGAPVPATPFTGRDAAIWTSRLNELQMLLHSHPVNQTRAARGRVPVNSLWLWGAGTPRRIGSSTCGQVLDNNLFARACAHYCALELIPWQASTARLAADRDGLVVVLEDC